jgi:nucleoside-diphosphate-sugar epimerase
MAIDPREGLSGRRVFVTGATGFIGRWLVRALVDGGAVVTVLSRSRGSINANFGSAVTPAIGDLNDREVLASNLVGQNIVLNLAYDVRESGAANLAAFDVLLDAAHNAAVERIVHTSSIVVHDGWPDKDIDDTGPMESPGGGAYRQAKIKMERKLMSGSLPAAILQPTIVYGPGSSLWTDQLAEALFRGGVVLPTPEGVCNGVFVDDVVQALLRAASVPDLGRERMIISGPAPFSWSDLLNGYAAIIGRGSVEHRPVAELRESLGPEPVANEADDSASVMARIGAIGRGIIGRERFEGMVRLARRHLTASGPMYPDRHLLGVFSATGICNTDCARKRLGYEPAFDLAKGLAATETHLKKLVGKI